METHRIYLMKLYQVNINNRSGEIVVQHFENSKFYFCNFINDKVGDFYILFDSFGFYVDNSNENPEYKINGKLTLKDAQDIWSQIEKQFNDPIDKAFIRVNF